MKKTICTILLAIFALTSNANELTKREQGEVLLEQFLSKTTPVMYGLNVRRLMIKTAETESDCISHFSTKSNIGMMQIEPASFKALMSDKGMRKTIQELEQQHNVDFHNYDKDTYTNIVVAYSIYIWKNMYGKKTLQRLKYKVVHNEDKEWLNYKLFYNSLEGAATYKRWNRTRTYTKTFLTEHEKNVYEFNLKFPYVNKNPLTSPLINGM